MSTTTNPSKKKARTILTGRRANDRGPRSRPRRSGLLAFATLMIAGSALAGAVLFARAGDTAEVLAVGDSVAKGHTITQGDLVAKNVTGIDATFSADESASVVGSTTVVDLVAGQVITGDMVSMTPTPGAGMATVGLNLDPARVPASGLDAGDAVDVIAVPSGENAAGNNDELDAPPVLAAGAQVYDVVGSATEGGGVLVTIVVDDSAAARIAAYSTAARVAVVETSAGAGAS